jgi:hypothetical protein
MVILRSPESSKPGLKLLAEISDEIANKVLTAVQRVPLHIDVDKWVESVSSDVEDINRDGLQNILQALALAYPLLEEPGFEVKEAVEGIVNGILQDEYFSEVSKQKLDGLAGRLTAFLNADTSLSVVAKASDLLVEFERIFSGARIVTDIRPVFKAKMDKDLAGAFIVHTLKIDYRDASGSKEFYIALDSSDVSNLIEQLFKAEEKAEVLQSLLNKANVTYIDPYPESERDE